MNYTFISQSQSPETLRFKYIRTHNEKFLFLWDLSSYPRVTPYIQHPSHITSCSNIGKRTVMLLLSKGTTINVISLLHIMLTCCIFIYLIFVSHNR